MDKSQFRSSSDAVVVSLTGGLGNQLFQTAHALFSTDRRPIAFTQAFGRPRVNEIGDPEILSFELPFEFIKLRESEANWLVRKFLGHMLKISENPRGIESFKTYRRFIKLVTGSLTSVYFGRKFKLLTKEDDSPIECVSPSNVLFVGYFQDIPAGAANEIKQSLRNLQLPNPSERFLLAKKYLDEHEVAILHMRLTDYLNEPDIGLLDLSYFESARARIKRLTHVDEFWVFSDDIELAKKSLQFSQEAKVRFISEREYSVAETFELMRIGSSYILSNSTFGWWAAFLCRKESSVVVIPKPWFRKLHFSESLYADNWHEHNSKWRSSQ